MSSSRGSSWPRHWTGVSCTAGGFFTSWATREVPICTHQPTDALPMLGAENTQITPPPMYIHHMYIPAHKHLPYGGGREHSDHPTSPCIYTTCIHQPINILSMVGAKDSPLPHPIIYIPYIHTSPQIPSLWWGLRTLRSPHLHIYIHHMYVKWKSLYRVRLFSTPWTIQSMEFSRPEHWSVWPFPSPGDLPNPGLLHCRRILYQLSHQGSPNVYISP